MSPTAILVLPTLATWRPSEVQAAVKCSGGPLGFCLVVAPWNHLSTRGTGGQSSSGSPSLQTAGSCLRRRGRYVANGEMTFVVVGDLAPAGLSQAVEQFVGPSPTSDRETGVNEAFPHKDFPCARKVMRESGLLTCVRWVRGSRDHRDRWREGAFPQRVFTCDKTDARMRACDTCFDREQAGHGVDQGIRQSIRSRHVFASPARARVFKAKTAKCEVLCGPCDGIRSTVAASPLFRDVQSLTNAGLRLANTCPVSDQDLVGPCLFHQFRATLALPQANSRVPRVSELSARVARG